MWLRLCVLQAGGDEAPPLLPANSPFKPMAQRIKEFQSKTPVRFRTRPGPAMPVRKMEMTDAKVGTLPANVWAAGKGSVRARRW